MKRITTLHSNLNKICTTKTLLWPSIHDSASGVVRCSEKKTKLNQ